MGGEEEGLRTRVICRDHGFEPDLFSPDKEGAYTVQDGPREFA